MQWPWTKKPVPKKPKWRVILDEVRYFGLVWGTVATLSSGFWYTFIAIDIDPFIQTTDVTAVAAEGHVYMSVENSVSIPELTYIIVNIDNQQVAHQVYPDGLPRGEHVFEFPVPFNIKAQGSWSITTDIIFKGPKTLFMNKKLTDRINVTEVTND